jgi:hypothetical protein
MSALVTAVRRTLETSSWTANFAQSTIDETPHHIRCIALVKNQFRIQMKTMLKECRV